MDETRQSPRHKVTEIAARVLWTALRLPALAFLILLEPFVCGVLWIFATLGILGAFFWRFLVQDPRYPFWLTIGLSIGAALLAGVYCTAIRLLGGGRGQ